MELLGGIGLLTPTALLVLPLAVAGLVYSYLKRGKGERRQVASTLILKRLSQVSSARKIFTPPPRFFLELLILALLGLAAAGLYQRGGGERIAIVVDNSLSMSAQRGGESSLSNALKDLDTYLNNLPSTTLVGVFLAAPNLQQLGRELFTPQQASRKIQGIEPELGADSLSAGVQKLLQDQRFDRVAAWSDKGLVEPNPRLQLRSFFQSGDNIAIGDVRVKEGPDRGRIVEAEIKAYTVSDRTVDLELLGVSEVAGRVEEIKLGQQRIRFAAGEMRLVQFAVPSAAVVGFVVRLIVPPGGIAADYDSIAADNQGFAVIGSGGAELSVVSPDPVVAASLKALRSFNVKWLSPAAYERSGVSSGLLIFHRTMPASLPDASALFLAPPAPSQLGDRLLTEGKIQISRWNEKHPIVSYLKVPLIDLQSAVILKKPNWAEDVIVSTQGSVAFAGEYAGKRYAAVGFDLLPFSGKEEPLLSVLTLNILKWLSGAAIVGAAESPPHMIPKSSTSIEQPRYLTSAPAGAIRSEDGRFMAGVPGVVRFSQDGKPQLLALQFVDDEESNVRLAKRIDVPATPPTVGDRVENSKSLWRPILWLVLLLIAVEIAMMFRQQRSLGNPGGRLS